MARRDRDRLQYGDFQTPAALAAAVVDLLRRLGIDPRAVVEPTCGQGAFLVAAAERFAQAEVLAGFEVQAASLTLARQALAGRAPPASLHLEQADFFRTDWPARLAALPDPLLVLGNPPWATNAGQSVLGSGNLPPKSNFQRRPGLAALTGRSNFDISEWMILRLLAALGARPAVLAMLCKTSVARRVLAQAWAQELPVARARMHRIDARASFGADVAACLLVVWMGARGACECPAYASLEAAQPEDLLGWRAGMLVADARAFDAGSHLLGRSPGAWRSGIKHDCARVMELVRTDGVLRNGLGEAVDLEERCLYPLVKGADLARLESRPARWMIVPQTALGEDPAALATLAPRTWRYLLAHAAPLDARASRIHRRRPRFSVFGVGAYSFAPWKVACATLARRPAFVVLGPVAGRPVVLDDTCVFLGFHTREEAGRTAALLASPPAQAFLGALLFPDAKRSITTAVLNRLDLDRLACALSSAS